MLYTKPLFQHYQILASLYLIIPIINLKSQFFLNFVVNNTHMLVSSILERIFLFNLLTNINQFIIFCLILQKTGKSVAIKSIENYKVFIYFNIIHSYLTLYIHKRSSTRYKKKLLWKQLLEYNSLNNRVERDNKWYTIEQMTYSNVIQYWQQQ